MDADNIAEYPCVNCTERLGRVHVECATCEDLRLCLECFACGAELSSHERTHPYRVKNAQGKRIFHDSDSSGAGDWRAAEEIALLEAVERFNLGNWNDVVNNVNKSRTPKELRDHYDKFYLRGKIGTVTRKNLKPPIINDHTEPVSNKSGFERESNMKANADDLTLLAYMPNRDDFEKEYNNDAESIISNLIVIQDDDEELDRGLKLALIDSYIKQLAERKRRRALIHEYNLIEKFFKQEKPQPVTALGYTPSSLRKLKAERELKDNLRKFTQLLPAHEFDDLIAGLMKEKALKERIDHLEQLQKSGVTHLRGTFLDQKSTFSQNLRLREDAKDENLDSVPKQAAKSNVGIVCDDTKSDAPKAVNNSNGNSKRTTVSSQQQIHPTISHSNNNNNNQTSCSSSLLLSESEKEICKSCSLTERDYILLKTSILKEQICKNNGVPLRKSDYSSAKENVKDFMTSSGWIPLLYS